MNRASCARRALQYAFIAAALSFMISAAIVFDEWQLNPGGIYKATDGGTHWPIVRETFFSWFWPLTAALFGLFEMFDGIVKAAQKLRRRAP